MLIMIDDINILMIDMLLDYGLANDEDMLQLKQHLAELLEIFLTSQKDSE